MLAFLYKLVRLVLYRLFSLVASRTQTKRVKNKKTIFPLHFLDQIALPSCVMNYTFRYNEVLDPYELHDSLVKLLGIGDWKKLGGRLRLNIENNGNREIHVSDYTTEHPAVRFSQANFDVRIEEHPIASCLPKKTGQTPSIQEGCQTFRSFSAPQNLPIQHYLRTDEPLISLHITSFTNATLVSICIPHSILDGIGTAELLRAWSNIVANQPHRVPTVLGAKEDVLETVGTSSDKEAQTTYVLQEKQIKGFSMLVMGLQRVWKRLIGDNTQQAHTIFLPSKFVSQLRHTAEDQLSLCSNEERPPFLSDGDLITAWCSRKIISCAKKRPAVIINVFDLRNRISNTFTSGASYLQNLILPAYVLVPAAEVLSFGQIALKLRCAITEQTTDTQARSLVRMIKESFASTGLMPIFGSSDSIFMSCSNWSKAGFLEAANFGPAVIPSSQSIANNESTVQPGSCVSYWGSPSNDLRNAIIIYGKDCDGNYWLHAYLQPEVWGQIRDEFNRHSSSAACTAS